LLTGRVPRHDYGARNVGLATPFANKLARATMSGHFFLASIVTMGREEVTLEDISGECHEPKKTKKHIPQMQPHPLE
jgi:hypothetical protein